MKALICIVIVVLILDSCSKEEEKESFYIPQDYTGAVAIVFNQKNGAVKEYKDDGRIYRIPQSGVLYTQFPIVGGDNLNQKFYYVNSSGEVAREIPTLFMPVLPAAGYDSVRVYAMVGIDGSFEKNTGDVEYIYFCVGHVFKSDSLRGEGYNLMERVREAYPEQIK